jgi:hypothetical protein
VAASARKVALFVGAGVSLLNLVSSALVWEHWDYQSRFGKVASWVPIADGVLGFPVRTIDAVLTHGLGPVVRVGTHRFDLFMWELLLNAALWGAVASMLTSQVVGKRSSATEGVIER